MSNKEQKKSMKSDTRVPQSLKTSQSMPIIDPMIMTLLLLFTFPNQDICKRSHLFEIVTIDMKRTT